MVFDLPEVFSVIYFLRSEYFGLAPGFETMGRRADLFSRTTTAETTGAARKRRGMRRIGDARGM